MDTASATGQETACELVTAYLCQVASQPLHVLRADDDDASRHILMAPADIQTCVFVECLGRSLARESAAGWLTRPIRTALLRKKLPFTQEQLEQIADLLLNEPRLYQLDIGMAGLVRLMENFAAEHDLPESVRERIARLVPHLQKIGDAEYRKAAERLARLLEDAPSHVAMIRWKTDEAWVEKVRTGVESAAPDVRGHWLALLLHCSSATASKPSQKWLKQAASLLEPLGNHFAPLATSVLDAIGQPARTPPQRMSGLGDQTDPTLIHEVHSELLRGLVWCTSVVLDDGLIQALGRAADSCFQKIPWIGPRSPKIGNACLFALSQGKELRAASELSRLKTRVKHASIKKQLGKSLETVADRTGMSADELEEVAVPTFGLTDVGRLTKQLGDVTVQIAINADGKADVIWQPAGKKPQASVPASVKEAFAADVKAIKRDVKEIERLLPAQRVRLERLFLQQAGWRFADFRARYLDHPLVGTLARRLIWRFEDEGHRADGIFSSGRMVAADDTPFDWLRDDTRVTLWHPSFAGVDEVLAWRNWLERHEVRQPFKQAHREIYRLTEAERGTAFYSNRFAAHILRQHQFAALCQARGWHYRLEGNFDSANTPVLELPRWGLRVEFLVQGVAGPTSAMMIYLYLSTDQVRFCRTGSPLPVPLEEVPPLVFSEVLRDVDLFIGVCSVGNDPQWHDGGPGGWFRDYWQAYAFGDLSATALTRRAILERIVPRLKIADRCSFLDRFLMVQGDLRTYKIHLGSGNILMSPNDQGLCIVPRPGAPAAHRVFLPFEGDEMLSIILSKAFLLAEDSKITDPTITRQLQK